MTPSGPNPCLRVRGQVLITEWSRSLGGGGCEATLFIVQEFVEANFKTKNPVLRVWRCVMMELGFEACAL